MTDAPGPSEAADDTRREVTADEARAILRSGDIEVLGRMPWSSYATFLAQVQSETPALVIYKPARGERPLWDFPGGTLCRREVAAAVVSDALEWTIVPPTVLRDGPLGTGMVQLFIEHDPDNHYFALRDDVALDHVFRRFAAFDFIVNNADRKAGHCILAADGHVWGIDHGLSFHPQPKLRTVIWDFVGDRVLPDVADDICTLAAELGDGMVGAGGTRDELDALLGADEIVALRQRCERLVRGGRYPEPETDYPYPWPTV